MPDFFVVPFLIFRFFDLFYLRTYLCFYFRFYFYSYFYSYLHFYFFTNSNSHSQGAPPSADYSYNQFGERFTYRDPIVPVSDPLPSYKPVTLEAYRARESAQQEREQQQQQQSQQQLQQQHYQQQPQQQQQQQFNDKIRRAHV